MQNNAQDPPISFSTAQTQLNTLLNDTDNFTFSQDQKTQALIEAWHDTWVVSRAWDSSLTYTDGTYQYPIPSTITALSDVYVLRDSNQYPEPISNDLWEVISLNGADTLQFTEKARFALTTTYTLYLKGRYKLATSDNLTTVAQINYVLSLAASLCLRKLSYMKVLRFLRNDTTLADIVNLKKEIEADVIYWRSQLAREYESA